MTGPLPSAFFDHTATRLTNGMVLVTGSYPSDNSGLYDPTWGTWTISERYLHTATLLPNGKVLVAGGERSLFTPNTLSSAELYDPASRNVGCNGPHD